jgi:UDP-2,3-diacylglucosamine hydrolase
MHKTAGKHIFFADLHHPGYRHAEIEQLFDNLPADTSHIFFLGDTFHYWINDDSFIEDRYAYLLSIMQAWAKEGIQLFFLEGNRDFLASHYLDNQSWIDVLGNPSVIDIAGRAVYLGHGDELCWNDWQYQFYKSIIRSRPMRFVANNMPSILRRKTVQKMAETSPKLVAKKTSNTLKVPKKAYEQVINTGVDMIIHGHLHRSYHIQIPTEQHNGVVHSIGWVDGKRNFIYL